MALSFPSNPTNGQTFNQYVYSTSIGAWQNQNDPTNVASLITGKANLAGGNVFTGYQLMPATPVFSAMRRAGTYSNGSNITIVFDSVHTNIGGCYNTSNGRFTAPVSGIYRFDCFVQKRSGGALNLYWYKNGSGYDRFVYSDLGGDSPSPGGSIYLNLVANDYISVVYSHSGGGDIYGASESLTMFSGQLIG